MSQYTDWIEIRNRGANVHDIVKDQLGLGEGLLIEYGAFPPSPNNSNVLVSPDDTGGQVRLLVKIQLNKIREILNKYPATVPITTIRATWPYPVPMPAASPQDPPAPPIIIPPLPPTTPPTANDKIYYV